MSCMGKQRGSMQNLSRKKEGKKSTEKNAKYSRQAVNKDGKTKTERGRKYRGG